MLENNQSMTKGRGGVLKTDPSEMFASGRMEWMYSSLFRPLTIKTLNTAYKTNISLLDVQRRQTISDPEEKHNG